MHEPEKSPGTDLYRQIFARAKQLEGETARFLMDMVRVPSFSGKEQGVIQVIKAEMEEVGFDEVRVDGLGNVIGRIGHGPRVIAFDAHVDTVYAGDTSLWKFDPFTPKIEDGKVWGRGTVDQEGGMASMVTAGKIIKEMGLNEKFTDPLHRHGDGGGLRRPLLDVPHQRGELRPELVVITEPTNMNIYRGHRGRMEMQVKVKGLSCHGSAPERGDNAIYKISRIALEIEKLHGRLANDAFLGKGSICVSQVFFTGPSQCAVPDSATLSLDRRLTVGETKESAVAEVKDAAARAGYPEVEVTILETASPPTQASSTRWRSTTPPGRSPRTAPGSPRPGTRTSSASGRRRSSASGRSAPTRSPSPGWRASPASGSARATRCRRTSRTSTARSSTSRARRRSTRRSSRS